MGDLIQQDLFGIASETKDKSKVKESFGCKTYDIIEIISKMIIFNPSTTTTTTSSSIHVITSPLLQRLNMLEKDNNNNSSKKIIHKIRECFHRIIIGLSKNNTCDINQVLLFVYATISPFIKNALEVNPNLIQSSIENDYDDDDDAHHNIKVSG